MDFISNKQAQITEMLAVIGVDSIDELFQSIPPSLKIPPIQSDDGLAEYEGMKLIESLAAKNSYPSFDNYLGGGAYEHHVPAIVSAICSKSEFLTAYTPYQAEASQGMLQVIFEFQSAICALTGMDVANASVYDGASACAEAVLMTLRHHKDRKKILIGGSLNPHYRGVVDQYLLSHDVHIETIPFKKDGSLDFDALQSQLDRDTAAVLVQYPNFFGVIDDINRVSRLCKECGALSILCANPLVYGLFASAADLGVDIAVGEGQPFGIPLQFGGPYVGYMACRQELVRQMPGRIVGETVDTEGRRGFVLTLQAREQHIRREKATSNICTNQALTAMASLVAMLWYGKQGILDLALTNYQRSHYLQKQLSEKSVNIESSTETTFNEFVVCFDHPTEHVQKHFRSLGIEPGISLEKYFPELKNRFLVAVTETKTKEQLDRYVQVASSL